MAKDYPNRPEPKMHQLIRANGRLIGISAIAEAKQQEGPTPGKLEVVLYLTNRAIVTIAGAEADKAWAILQRIAE